MHSDKESFMSPPRPVFYDVYNSPLSTKQERKRSYSRSVPRLIRTAPALCRVYPRRFSAGGPHFVSFKMNLERVVPKSPYYDPNCMDSYFEQCFDNEKKIGEGSFGEVFRVRWKDDGRWYAVKRSIEYYRNAADRELKLREVQKHELLPKHRNLIEFIQAWEESGRLYIQTELCEYSLADYCQREHNIGEEQIWFYFSDLVAAVAHLHEHNLLHLDIKPENIFVSNEGICKLGDFGLIFDIKKDTALTAQEGDSKYLAPEVLNEPPDKAADIFSLGITILELATDLDLPPRGLGWQMLRRCDIPEQLRNKMSPRLRSMVLWMMDPAPEKRPTAEQLLQDVIIRHYLELRKVHTIRNVKSLSWMWLYVLSSLRWLFSPIVSPICRWRKRRYNSTPIKSDGNSSDSSLSGMSVPPSKRPPCSMGKTFAHAQTTIRDSYHSDDEEGLNRMARSPACRRINPTWVPMHHSLDDSPGTPTTSSSSADSFPSHYEHQPKLNENKDEERDESPSEKRLRLSESPVRTPLTAVSDNGRHPDNEEDDDEHEIVLVNSARRKNFRNAMSAPVRRSWRSYYRGEGLRPISKLDFSILDSPTKDTTPPPQSSNNDDTDGGSPADSPLPSSVDSSPSKISEISDSASEQ